VGHVCGNYDLVAVPEAVEKPVGKTAASSSKHQANAAEASTNKTVISTYDLRESVPLFGDLRAYFLGAIEDSIDSGADRFEPPIL